jgi:hypothetical protein
MMHGQTNIKHTYYIDKPSKFINNKQNTMQYRIFSAVEETQPNNWGGMTFSDYEQSKSCQMCIITFQYQSGQNGITSDLPLT